QKLQIVNKRSIAKLSIQIEPPLQKVHIDLEYEINRPLDETIQQLIAAQVTHNATYLAMRTANPPIPYDLRDDVDLRAIHPQHYAAEEQPRETTGLTEPGEDMALAPTPEELAAAKDPDVADAGGVVVPLPRNRIMDSSRPEESDEMRATMPKPAYRLRS